MSIETTNIYAEVDPEMKSKALALCEVGNGNYSQGKAKAGSGVMGFLKEL